MTDCVRCGRALEDERVELPGGPVCPDCYDAIRRRLRAERTR